MRFWKIWNLYFGRGNISCQTRLPHCKSALPLLELSSPQGGSVNMWTSGNDPAGPSPRRLHSQLVGVGFGGKAKPCLIPTSARQGDTEILSTLTVRWLSWPRARGTSMYRFSSFLFRQRTNLLAGTRDGIHSDSNLSSRESGAALRRTRPQDMHGHAEEDVSRGRENH